MDTRDIAEAISLILQNSYSHQNSKYVITGNEALDFYEVANIMTQVMNVNLCYTNPSVKEFKEFMLKRGEDEDFINVVIDIHFPTKLGLAKGISNDFKSLTNKKPLSIKTDIEDYKDSWL